MSTPRFSLREGCRGPATKRLQAAVGIAAPDGVFGPKTTAALKIKQASLGLTADGVAGPLTCTALGLPVPVLGVDVSKWQGQVDWHKMAADGVQVAIVRVSHGLGSDSTGAANLARAAKAGLRAWAYHYAKPDPKTGDASAEAEFAFKCAAGFPLVLDLEQRDGLTLAQTAKWAADWIVRVQALQCGKTPIVYCNRDYVVRVFGAGDATDKAAFRACPLWLADPDGNGDGNLPANDIWSDCAAVQFSWTGDLGGEKPLDLNWWYF